MQGQEEKVSMCKAEELRRQDNSEETSLKLERGLGSQSSCHQA